jgi:hypothetical protein
MFCREGMPVIWQSGRLIAGFRKPRTQLGRRSDVLPVTESVFSGTAMGSETLITDNNASRLQKNKLPDGGTPATCDTEADHLTDGIHGPVTASFTVSENPNTTRDSFPGVSILARRVPTLSRQSPRTSLKTTIPSFSIRESAAIKQEAVKTIP